MATNRPGPTAGSMDGRRTQETPETPETPDQVDDADTRARSEVVVTGQRPPPALDRVVVVGGGQVGRRLAARLARDAQVHHLDDDEGAVRDPEGYDASCAPDLTAPAALATTGADADHTAVVVTGDDGRNLLVAQHLRGRLGVGHVVVVLSDPRNRPAFDIPGVSVICRGVALADSVTSAVPADLDPLHGAPEPSSR